MKRSLPLLVIALAVGNTPVYGQNIVLERQTDIRWLFPIIDIDGDGIPELYGENSLGEPGLYNGSTLELEWTLPGYPDVDDETHILSPFLDFNSDGNKDVILESVDENYNTTGFRIHDIVNNTTIYEYNDSQPGSWDDIWAWIYLADIDGDNEVEIMALFSYEDATTETYKTLIFSTSVALSAGSPGTAPSGFRLAQNYPNPFNPATNIKYSISERGHVVINVYDIKGRAVDKLVDSEQGPGHHRIVWDARQLSSGMYLYQIVVDGQPTAAKKAIFLK